MGDFTTEKPAKSIGSGRLDNLTAGTAQALTDGVINLSDGGSISANTIAYVPAAEPVGPTITDTGNGFIDAGFKAGTAIRVVGSASNDGAFLITTVTAGTLELDGSTDLIVEAAGTTNQIYKVFSMLSLVVIASKSNAGVVYIGASGVSSANGAEISPGLSSTIGIRDLSKVFVDVATTNDDVTFGFLYD